MCKVTSKALMGIMTIIFWGAAAGLLFIGAWVFKEYNHYEQLVRAYYTLIPAAIVMGVGFFFFVLGLIGCVGAFKEQRCLLASFFTVLLLILLSMIVAASLGYVYRKDIDESVRSGIKRGLNDYNNDSVLMGEVDFMQRELTCCGLNNYTDWLYTSWYKEHKSNLTVPYPDSCCISSPCTNDTNVFNKLQCCGSTNYTEWEHTPWGEKHQNLSVVVPSSCCPDQQCHFESALAIHGNRTVNMTSLYFSRGCYTHLKDEFRRHLGVIAGVAAGFGILQIFGMIAACGLFCKRRNTNTYIGLTSPEHMRV